MTVQNEEKNQSDPAANNATQEQQSTQSGVSSVNEKKGGGCAPGCITFIIIAMACGFIGQMGSLGMLLAVGLIAGCGILLFSESHRNKAVEAAKIPSSVAKNIRIWLVVAGVFLIATIGQISDQNKAKAEIAKAHALWEKGDKAKAADLYESALSRTTSVKPGDRAAILEKVIEYHAAEGSASKAEKLCRDAVNRGISISLRGEKAQELYNKALAAHEAAQAQRAAAERERKVATAGKADISVQAWSLVQEYDANEVSADDKYKGKKLRVSGTIENIGKDIIGGIYVTLDGSGPIRDVQCTFARSEKSKVAKLSKGMSLTVVGKCKGLMMNVQLDDCIIIDD